MVRALVKLVCLPVKLVVEELVPPAVVVALPCLRHPTVLLPSRRQWEVPLWMTETVAVGVAQFRKRPWCSLPKVVLKSERFQDFRQLERWLRQVLRSDRQHRDCNIDGLVTIRQVQQV